MKKNLILSFVLTFMIVGGSFAAPGDGDGPYSNGYGGAGMDQGIPGFISGDVNPIFVGWATQVVQYIPSDELGTYGRNGVGVSPYTGHDFSDPTKALGPVTGDLMDIVSLGDLNWESGVTYDEGVGPGILTLGFDKAITNGPGADFAAFENGFGNIRFPHSIFAELGFVEVSTNGADFARFPTYYGSATEPVGGYGNLDVTYLYNFVGKHGNAYDPVTKCYGTPFDLDDLLEDVLVQDGIVDLNEINYVRIVDIAGNGYFTDSNGNLIYDAWETYGSGGVDFEALGVIHAVPEPSVLALLLGLATMGILLRQRIW